MPAAAALILLAAAILEQAERPEVLVARRYLQALGGEAALRAVRSRTTDGQFDNGRGLRTRFRSVEAAPNKKVTLIGVEPIGSDGGSGRGFDGTAGWDKNFIGSGLRVVEGAELAALAREADLLRPLHLFDGCSATSVTGGADAVVVTCTMDGGSLSRFHFDPKSGLLAKQETEGGALPAITVVLEDYRPVDGVRVPFRTRIILPGANVTYTAESVRHNQQVDQQVFERPRSN